MFAVISSKLAVSALALSTLAMAGVGPKADYDVNIRIGDGHYHRRPHVVVPPPVIVRPPVVVVPTPVVVHRPAEAAPTALQLEAYQTDDTILIIARGDNPYAGFATSLERAGRFGRPSVTLHNIAPVFFAAPSPACTPFVVTGTIDHCPRLAEITVCIAGVDRCVPVTQVGDMPRGW